MTAPVNPLVAGLPFSTTWAGSRIPVIYSYPFAEYADDEDIDAFFQAFNIQGQEYVDWFNQVNLPIYSGPVVSGDLLDWVGAGLYGVERPTLAFGTSTTLGPYATWAYATNGFAIQRTLSSTTFFAANDDVYRRVLTWGYYRGDGRYFDITWLKRRVSRFLHGVNGTDINPTQFQNVSVMVSGSAFTINIPTSQPFGQTFQACVEAGIIELPFQYSFTVNLV